MQIRGPCRVEYDNPASDVAGDANRATERRLAAFDRQLEAGGEAALKIRALTCLDSREISAALSDVAAGRNAADEYARRRREAEDMPLLATEAKIRACL